MPEIPIEIINLHANAGFNEGIINGNVQGSLSAGVNISADLCHGINVGVDAAIAAKVLGNLDFLFLGAQAQGEASAAAGARAKILIEPNPLERLGLSIYVGAFARAMASGSLSIYLTPDYISQKVQDHLDDFSADLFLIFAEEFKAEVGVWGRIAFSAMAEANLNVLLDINRLSSGFEISGGYKLGLKAGTGYDFYCDVGFKDLRRAVNRSSIRICQEVKQHILATNLDQKELLAEAFDFSFPFVALLSFDLGNKSVERGEFLQKEEVAQLVFDNFMANLQRYAVDRIFDAATQWLTNEFANLYEDVFKIQLNENDRSKIIESVNELVDILEKGDFRLPDISAIVRHVSNIVDVLDAGHLDSFKKPISLLWVSTVVGLEIRQVLGSVTAAAGIGSTLTGTASTSIAGAIYPNAPELVKEEVQNTLNVEFVEIDSSIAIDYLIEEGINSTEEWIFPQILEFKELFETTFNLTFGDLMEDLLRGLRGEGSLASYNSYTALKTFVKDEAIDRLLMGQLIPEIENEIDDPIFSRYAQEVMKPSLHLSSDFVFKKLDNFLIDDLSGISNLPAFVNGISAGSGAVVYQLIARNIAFFDEIVTDFMLDNIYLGFQNMGNQFNNPNDPFYLVCKNLLQQSFPHVENTDIHAETARQLLIDLAFAFREITGPTIYTAERRIHMRNLKRDILLSMSGDIDYGSSSQAFVDRLLDCGFLPNQELAEELSKLLYEISLDSFLLFWEKIVPALGDFFLAISLHSLSEIRENLSAFIDALRTKAEDALLAFNELNQAFNEELLELLESIDTAVETFKTRLDKHLDEWGATAKANIYFQKMESLNAISNDTQRETAIIAFQTTWVAEASILDLAISAGTTTLKTSLELIVANVDTLTDIAQSIVQLKQDVENGITNGLIGFVLSPIADTATYLIESILPQEMMDSLELYLGDRKLQKDLERERFEKEEALSILELEKVRTLEAYNRNNFNPTVDLEVIDPINDFQFIYPKEVLFEMLLRNGNHNMISDPSSKRIQVQLNGNPVDLAVGNWSSSSVGMVFSNLIENVLHGLNILEVSFVKGILEEDTLRQKIAFAVDENAPYKRANFDVSILVNPPGDDTLSEHVQINYKGEANLKAHGWMMQDKAGHKYHLPKLTLKPNDIIRIYTGGNPADDKYNTPRKNKILHMGRRKAVWNNEGDTLYLVDFKNVLIYTHTYII